jgi:hypothetical protein
MQSGLGASVCLYALAILVISQPVSSSTDRLLNGATGATGASRQDNAKVVL